MNNKIDIVVTYLNSGDKEWQSNYRYWKEKEIKEGKQSESNQQAFGIERIREWDNFKYWFRGVEKNCPWVNKVFLIVQNENHVPKWLNRDNKKLRIVYHDEYIPKELLPTFNAMTIEMYINRIKDLSDNYVICNDDFFFLNEIKEDKFFRDNVPVQVENRIHFGYYDKKLGVFYEVLNNNLRFESRYMKDENIKYNIYHLPSARNKTFEKQIMDTHYNTFLDGHIRSKFRQNTNFCAVIYDDLLKLLKRAFIDEFLYSNSKYVTLRSGVNYNDYKNCDMVCFNDTEQLDDFEKTKEELNAFLSKKFSKKSSFEV